MSRPFRWEGASGIQIQHIDPSLVPCEYAAPFAEWADTLLATVATHRTEVSINRAILLLTKRYFEWYLAVPKKHRQAISDRGHRCIFHVFRDAYCRLREVSLLASPPPLEPPLPPALPLPPPQFAGIVLAERGDLEE